MTRLKTELTELRQDLETQAEAIENLNGEVLRWKLVNQIQWAQFEIIGYKPIINESEAATLPIEELTEIYRDLKQDLKRKAARLRRG